MNNFGLCHHCVSKGMCLYYFARMKDSIPVDIEELSFKRQCVISFTVYKGDITNLI